MDYAHSLIVDGTEYASDINHKVRLGAQRTDFGPHVCVGIDCEQPATMVAVGENPKTPSGEYAVSPHFRIKHTPECTIAGEETLVGKGIVTGPAENHRFAGANYPASLTRPTTRDVTEDPATPSTAPAHQRTASTPSVDAEHRGPRRSAVSTIEPICRHYLHYAAVGFDNRTLTLPARTDGEQSITLPYAEAFRHLPKRYLLTAVRQHIVFAQLMWSRAGMPDTSNPDHIVLTFYAGPINPDTRKPDPAHRLIIDWSTWPQRARDITTRELHAKYDATHDNEALARQSNKHRGETEWLFAYANPTIGNDTDLTVTSAADFCILTAPRTFLRPQT